MPLLFSNILRYVVVYFDDRPHYSLQHVRLGDRHTSADPSVDAVRAVVNHEICDWE